MAPSPLQRPSTSETSQELKRVRERETELKRSRGEISCAECRRLKLRCDKKVPCSSCVRRGCETICPNGILSAGQGTRLVLADSDKLRGKLAEMAKRIRQLEDALQIEHAGRSTSPHPLLSQDQLMIKTRIEGTGPTEESKDLPEEEGLRQAFGVLALSEDNTVRWLGVSGSEQTLLLSEMDSRLLGQEVEEAPERPSLFLTPIQQASQMWPFTPMYLTGAQLKEQLLAQLPTFDRGKQLCEMWLENISWFHRPVKRSQIFEDLLPAVYQPMGSGLVSDSIEKMDVHELALLFSLFSCGATADLSLSVWNAEAETFQQLARAALGLRSVFDASSIASAQAICMLSSFDVISGRKSSLESAWKTTSFAFTLALSMGLHRDPAKWGLDPKEVQLRRSVFWEMNVLDNWKSLASGRPKTFDTETSDCELPIDDDATVGEDGSIIPSLWGWKYVFARDILGHVVARLCSAKPLKYSEVLELDKRIRAFDYKEFAPVHVSSPDGHGPKQRLQGIDMSTWFREVAMLYTHRNFFARALIDHPTDPLRSTFAQSFLAAYRSATSLLRIMRQLFDQAAQLLIRLWPMWAHALASSVIVGSVVARAPASNLAPSAFIELELAIELFARAETHPVAKVGLPILRRIRDKAQKALYELRSGKNSSGNTGDATTGVGQLPVLKSEDPDDELAILRGQTKTIVRKMERQSPGGSVASNTPVGSGSGSSPASMASPEKTMTSTGESSASPNSRTSPTDQSTEQDPAVVDIIPLLPSQQDIAPTPSHAAGVSNFYSSTTSSSRPASERGNSQLMAELRKLASEMSVFVESPPPAAGPSQHAVQSSSTSPMPSANHPFIGASTNVTMFTTHQPGIISSGSEWAPSLESDNMSTVSNTEQRWSQQARVNTFNNGYAQSWTDSSNSALGPSSDQNIPITFDGLNYDINAGNPSLHGFDQAGMSIDRGIEQGPAQAKVLLFEDPNFAMEVPYNPYTVGAPTVSEQIDRGNGSFEKDWMNIVQDTGFLDPEELKMWEGFDF